MNIRLIVSVSLASALLAACAPAQQLQRSDDNYRDTVSEARGYIDQMRQPHTRPVVQPRETVVISQEQWVDRQPIRSAERRIPTTLNCTIVFKPLVPTSLMHFAQQVSQDCQVAVRVTPDAIAAVSSNGISGGSNGGSALNGLPPLPRLPNMPGGAAGGMSIQPMMSSSASLDMLSDIDWRGSLSGLLDLVTARSGLSWRYNEPTRSISIFHLDTRTYRLDAFPTVTNMQSTIQAGMAATTGAGGNGSVGAAGNGGGTTGSLGGGANSGGGVSGTAGSSQTTSVTMSTSLYADVESTIKSFMTPNVGRMAISASTGAVSVTDTPEVLDRIGELLDRENATLRKQIILHTKVLSVTLDDNNEAGVNWDVVYRAMSGKYGLDFKTPFQPAKNAGTLGASIINSGEFGGSGVVLSALSTLGKVTTVTSPSVTTLNLRPAPVQIARQIGYIASSQIAQTQGAGTVGALTPGFVTVGFNMSLVPRLLEDDNEMMLQYSINISSLNQLRSVTAAGTTIEFPDIDTRLFNSEVTLRSGETLILHGFEQDTTNGNRSGMGSPFAWMLGGGMKASYSRQAIVILITPEVRRPTSSLARVQQ